MARIRTIKPEFPQSESMGRVSRDARLLFIMLWTLSDDEGRARASSRMLASLLFPYDDDAARLIPEWLIELEREHCVRVYSVDGNTYVQIEKWLDHQKIDHPTKSKFPSPPEKLAKPRERSRNSRSGPGREGNGRDQGMEGTKEGTGSAPQSVALPPFISLPTNRSDEQVPVSEEKVLDWQTTFPAVDVRQELREMRGWLIDNPDRRKTARGMSSFIHRWLGKEQDRGGKTQGLGRAPAREQGRGLRGVAEHALAAVRRTQEGNSGGGAQPGNASASPIRGSERGDAGRAIATATAYPRNPGTDHPGISVTGHRFSEPSPSAGGEEPSVPDLLPGPRRSNGGGVG